MVEGVYTFFSKMFLEMHTLKTIFPRLKERKQLSFIVFSPVWYYVDIVSWKLVFWLSSPLQLYY